LAAAASGNPLPLLLVVVLLLLLPTVAERAANDPGDDTARPRETAPDWSPAAAVKERGSVPTMKRPLEPRFGTSSELSSAEELPGGATESQS
jgi:hypothetical protein